jgi:energy-coupling factor transporter ATP-binding protein EcfA2
MAVQNQFFTLGFSVRQIIEMAGPAEEVMKQLHLTPIANRHVTTLSGGEAQRVAIAQAIAAQTPILLLDEPFAAQDVDSRKRIISILKSLAEKGTTVVVVVHASESDLDWADKVIKNFA